MKCLIGLHAPTSGQIIFDGRELGHFSPAEALEMGISMIHQELNPILLQFFGFVNLGGR
jgi:methyl-galactoside transport system ATP-binding protein/inositol transport system ATP-binding protein